jgi:hypothetical protein
MIRISTDTQAVVKMAVALPKQITRATERSIDYTARHIQADEKRAILLVFDSPVDYTINAIKVTPTKHHNMTASVWIATPPRMEQSYLVPQVVGGHRKLKGFELAADRKLYNLGAGAKRTAHGNITVAQAKAVVAGSKRRSPDFVLIKKGNKSGLPPGVYQRFSKTKGFSRSIRRTATRMLDKGRNRGRFTSAIAARGLKPILIEKENQNESVKPLLDFFGVAYQTFDERFVKRFRYELAAAIRG